MIYLLIATPLLIFAPAVLFWTIGIIVTLVVVIFVAKLLLALFNF